MNNRSHLKRFASDRSGNFALIFSLSLIPLMAGIGLAVDYTYAVQGKTRLYDATDAAALFAAVEYRKTGSMPTDAKVADFLMSDFAAAGGENIPELKKLELKNEKVYVDTAVQVPTALMGLFGYHYTDVAAAAVVNVGADEDIEIALSLDTTASMEALSGSTALDLSPDGTGLPPGMPGSTPVTRIQALRFAASTFTTSLFAKDAGKGKIRIAIVPFAQYVNVGTDKRGQSWLSVPDDKANDGQTCYDRQDVVGSTDCHDVDVIIDGAHFTRTVCNDVYGPKYQVCYPSGGTTWYGCIGSRNEPLNLRDASPGTKFPGLMDTWCTAQMQALSGDQNAVLTTINNLWTGGNTYIPEGVMWGARMLSKLEPFTEVKQPGGIKKVKKIMVLMTDGDNQAAADIPLAPTHHGLDPNAATYAAERGKTDAWTLEACDQAKAADIELYTISFGTDISAQARNTVKSCATDAMHYFDAKDAQALSDAFNSIAANVQALYLAG